MIEIQNVSFEYISSGSFRIWKSAAACFMMIPFPCVFSP